MMDMLDLIAGARAQPRELELTPEDLESPGPRNCVLRLRHTHHMLARAVAEGKSNIEAAALTGYAPQTVASLRGDPAFAELVAHYKVQVDDLFASIQDRIGALGVSFLDELQHRLETKPESFSIGQLQKLAESLLDRSIAPSKGAIKGAAPSAISVRIDFTAPEPKMKQVLELEPSA